MEIQEKNNLYEIAETVLGEVFSRKSPFDKITLVFHSAKIEQWFKSYFLKTHTEILMNVEFVTLSAYINSILNPQGDKHILTASEYREYIIKALLTGNLPETVSAFYKNGDLINGINLYEFADKLATVIFNMEFDNEDIITEWQKAVYETANGYAEKIKNYTPKCIYDASKNSLCKTDGKVYIINNSYISELYKEILGNFENITVYSLAEDTAEDTAKNATVELYAAPSKMREVEWLHTEICNKINKKDDGQSVGNFVVYAPNINDYANTIRRVFQRSKSRLPEVPFRIIGEGTEKRDMINALNILYDIANKGFFTRYDLQKFIKLPMVMFVNDLTNEDVDAFKKAVESTSTHRNSDNAAEFEDFKKRLLVSMLADNTVSLKDDTEYLAYANMNMDERRINQLIDIIDKLSNWASLFAGELSELCLDNDTVKSISYSLNALFSSENKYGEEKNYLYADVKEEIGKIIEIFSDTEIPAITLLLLLQDAPNRYSSSPADVFAGGVTFLSLGVDNIVPEKNVYVLGLSSDNFPRIENKNEIDFSENHKYNHELDKIAFANILKSTGEITVSFVNRDLQTDEEFFPSTVIPSEVREEYNSRKDEEDYKKMHIISLDEDRDTEKLFTYRELLNKMRVANMGAEQPIAKTATVNTEKNNNAENVPEIKTSQIKKYFENTVVYKYSQLLKDSDDEDKSKSEEYEIIDLDGLRKYDIVKQMILAATDENCNPTENEEKYQEFKTCVLHKMQLENKLPKEFAEAYFDKYFNDSAKPVIDILKNDYRNKNYEKVNEFTLDMKSDGKEWTLIMNTLCFVKAVGTSLSFIEPREKGKDAKHFLPLYVCALAYVASKNAKDTYTVTLITENEKTFKVNSDEAKTILNEIFNAMQDLDNIKYMDIEFVDEIANKENTGGDDVSEENVLPKTISELLYTIGNKENYSGHDSWKNFTDQKLLNPDTDFGYSDPNEINKEMLEECEKIIGMILYYSKESNNEAEGEN